MNEIERLQVRLADRLPDSALRLTRPYLATGFWGLGLWLGDDYYLGVEWKAELGFGVTTPEDGDMGVGVDEIYPDLEAAYQRIVELVLSGGVTDGHPDSVKNTLPL